MPFRNKTASPLQAFVGTGWEWRSKLVPLLVLVLVQELVRQVTKSLCFVGHALGPVLQLLQVLASLRQRLSRLAQLRGKGPCLRLRQIQLRAWDLFGN